MKRLAFAFASLISLVAGGCVESLPIEGAPCPCGVDFVCDEAAGRCVAPRPSPDGSPPNPATDPSIYPDGGTRAPQQDPYVWADGGSPSPNQGPYVWADGGSPSPNQGPFIYPDGGSRPPHQGPVDVHPDGGVGAPSIPRDASPPPSPDVTPTPAGQDPCAGQPFEPGCGTNGLYYGTACDAALAGTGFRAGDLSCLSTGSCAVLRASATGACGRLLGWAWTGGRCEALVGCSCTGPDCTQTYPTLGACERAHFMCSGEPRCNEATVTCAADQACTYQGPGRCRKGAEAALGRCVARPTSCPPVTQPVCGCDGVTYASLCEARRAGVDTAAEGACTR